LAKLEVVGVGPGSPDYVTLAARKAVGTADLVIGAKRSIALFEDIKGETAVLTAKNLHEALQKAAGAVKSGKNVVFLSTGDPGFSGLLHTIQESGLFIPKEINVVPGVSSIQASAARLVISWDTARLFTFHDGEVSEDEKSKLISACQLGYNIILLPATKGFTSKDIAVLLLDAGANPETAVYICENVTLENEKITQTTLVGATSQTFGSLSVMVIKQKA